jgi:NAD(P)-dependent dehydrogenase (short-subunit alcohol dehydrogenase family)
VDIRLDGRAALVTGSSSGIGAAIAKGLAASGAFVVVTGRDAQRGQGVVDAITKDGGSAALVVADLGAGEPAISALADEAAHAAGGHIDILVNNAGRLTVPAPTADVPAESIMASLAVNVAAPFLLTGTLAPRMAAHGGGAIVNVGSINGLVGMPQSALYSMTKAALHSLTKSWAAEYAASGVRVNTVAPGPTRVEWNEGIGDLLAPVLARVPSHRMSEAHEIADAVVFLSSEHASHIHGATLAVDGGFSAT